MTSEQPQACMHLRKLDVQLKREFKSCCEKKGLNLHDAVELLMKLVVERKIVLDKDSEVNKRKRHLKQAGVVQDATTAEKEATVV